MGARPKYQISEGWVARGWRFEVEMTTPAQGSVIAQHLGARRFAQNWALAQIKANLDARAADPSVPPLDWNLPTLRRSRPGDGAVPRKRMHRGLLTSSPG